MSGASPGEETVGSDPPGSEPLPTEAATIEAGAEQRSEPIVVGIGASAGGLAALKSFFQEVPPDSGLAFVVVVHLSPEHESHLAELLQPFVRFPVTQVTDITPLEPDHLYVIPPNRNLSTIDTHLRPSALERQRRRRAPIDHFFRTLADTHDGNGIGVILTGTGSDGALGLKAIKERGGLTVVQDPDDADYDGMPKSAISTGHVDLVLPLADIPEAILRFAGTEPRVVVPSDSDDVEEDGWELLLKIFTQVHVRTGRDFSRYKRSTVLRRIRRRMQLLHLVELADYLTRLREDADEVVALADELLITVSSFFRDPEVFAALASDVIPAVFEDRTSSDTIRVWSVGCATGEEAYSLAMLLLEEADRRPAPPRIQVFASDLHERSLERARAGFYPGDIDTDVSPARLERFFTREEVGYRVRENLREIVVFAPHNLLSDPPFSRVDLITCRNLLIYLQRDIQGDVVQLFHYALASGGWLVLGQSETLEVSERFAVQHKSHCIYRKRNVPVAEPRLPVFPLMRVRPSASGDGRDRGGEPVSYVDIHRRLLEGQAPPSLLVAPDDRVVHLSDRAGRFLLHPAGELTSNVLRLVREELALEVRSGLHAAREQGEIWVSAPVRLHADGEDHPVVVKVMPSPVTQEDGFVLVLFESTEREPIVDPPGEGAAGAGVRRLQTQTAEAEADRDRARQRLQAIIEEYATSQEELRASNEELQSANEELRSTLEELETSKEELQSMNEELQTVNQENRHKVEELGQLSADLQNLLVATDIATLFLDRELRIMRFTPTVSQLFNIRTTDQGRPISDLTHRLGYSDLADDAAEVLRRLVPIEREVRDETGRHYLVRLLAYRSTDDRIEGVVITFVDITNQKAAEEAIRRSEEWTRHFADAVPNALFTTDAAGVAQYVSPQIETIAGVAPGDVVGTIMWPAIIHRDDRAAAAEAWAEASASGKPFEMRYRLVRSDSSDRWVIVRAVPVDDGDGDGDGDGHIEHWFGSITDVDALSRAEQELRDAKRELEARVAERTREVRDLATTLTLAEIEERRRIGQMLHDELQQQLYAVQLKLSLLREDVERHLGKEAAHGLIDADARLVGAIELTRSLTVDLSPPLLGAATLADVLTWLARQMRELHGLHVEIAHDEAIPVSEETRAILFYVAREVLFNVSKHAGTDRARIVLDRAGEDVVLRMSDDGRGFDVDMATAPDAVGMGLVGINERIRLLGGRVEIQSSPGDGTRIAVYAPID